MEKIIRTCPSSFSIDKIGRIKSYDSKQKEIRKELIKLTNFHCSYCDCLLPLNYDPAPPIEHFKPKKYFSNLKGIWYNLFISCINCNRLKGDMYPKIKPLKPDTEEYSFVKWFEIKLQPAEIYPNKFLSNIKKRTCR